MLQDHHKFQSEKKTELLKRELFSKGGLKPKENKKKCTCNPHEKAALSVESNCLAFKTSTNIYDYRSAK